MTTRDPATTVEHEVTIDAPPARVFAALTEPAELVRWWGSEDTYHVTAMTSDLRVGGTWRTEGHLGPPGGKPFAVTGVYREIDAPHVVEFTWRYDWAERAGDPETVVRYELTERDGRTRLRVIHWGFDRDADRQDHQDGWPGVIGWMRAHVEGVRPSGAEMRYTG